MNEPVDWELIQRYVLDTCSPEERSQVEQWIGADLARRETVAHVRAITDAAIQARPRPDFDRSWNRLLERIEQPRHHDAPAPSHHRWRWMLVAASLLVATTIGVGVVRNRGLVYVAPAGQRLSVTLVDGTRFVLGPASRLRVRHGYRNGAREMTLDGEAFFTVTHDPKRPLIVRTRGVVTRDIGTRFDVRAYAGDSVTRVAVAEGEVAVNTVPVRGGDVASAGTHGIEVIHGANVDAATSWASGRLAFEGTSLRQVVAELSRWYGVTVTVAGGPLGDAHIDLTIAGQSLDEVLEVVASLVHARVDRRDGAYALVATGGR